MRILVVGAGGVGASMASIAETRDFFDTFVLADISKEAAETAIKALDDPGKFVAEQVDASSVDQLVALIERTKADVTVNACDPRLNPQIFEACYRAGCSYIDMAMNLSSPALAPLRCWDIARCCWRASTPSSSSSVCAGGFPVKSRYASAPSE